MVTPQTTWKHHEKLLETKTSQYHLPSSPEEQP